MKRLKVKDIRKILKKKLKNKDFVIDKSGVKMIEILNANFIADEDAVFGTVNEEWNKRELSWYESQSLYVKDIPGKTPQVWEMVSDKNGKINSNYGWAVWSKENGRQYENTLNKLLEHPESRQAVMIYNRNSMHKDWNAHGMSDFMCFQNTYHYIRKNKLIMVVNSRSTDALFGYKGDYFWAKHVHSELFKDLERDYPKLKKGKIHWNSGSFHVYERHFDLVK